jgi:hypothetical protein
MAANNIKLQRTSKGEGEIRKKSHSLTQSQRLILATVDGVSQIAELQRKLGGMAKRRFTLAIADLTARGLVEEAKNPLVPDRLDLQLVECFVRQDPLDPITISALYLQAPPRPAAKSMSSNKPSPEVDFFIPLTPPKIKTEPKWEPPAEDAKLVMGNTGGDDTKHGSSRRRERRELRSKRIQMGYYLLFAGLVVVVVGVIAWFHLHHR